MAEHRFFCPLHSDTPRSDIKLARLTGRYCEFLTIDIRRGTVCEHQGCRNEGAIKFCIDHLCVSANVNKLESP